MAQCLIEGTYCGRMEPMLLRPGTSPWNRLLTDLVIHAATSLQHGQDSLLTVFKLMISNPKDLKV